MTYDETVEALQTLFEVPLADTDENFQRMVPRALEYANNRIYRDLKFLASVTSQTGLLLSNAREQALPASVIVLRSINVITPVGSITNTSKRNPLERVSLEALDWFWPQASVSAGVPVKYAIVGNSSLSTPYTVRYAPEPSASYTAEYLGVIRPPPLGPVSPNTTTFLSLNYPELHMAACGVYVALYQRDVALQGGTQASGGWEAQYTMLRDAAMIEAAQQHGEGARWSNLPPPPIANAPRDMAPEQ